jgi:hypothetical protein
MEEAGAGQRSTAVSDASGAEHSDAATMPAIAVKINREITNFDACTPFKHAEKLESLNP